MEYLKGYSDIEQIAQALIKIVNQLERLNNFFESMTKDIIKGE